MPESQADRIRIMTVRKTELDQLRDELQLPTERVEQIAYEEGRESAEKAFLEMGTDLLEKKEPGLFLGYYIAPLQHPSQVPSRISEGLFKYWYDQHEADLLGQDFRVKQWLSGWCQQMEHERKEQLSI